MFSLEDNKRVLKIKRLKGGDDLRSEEEREYYCKLSDNELKISLKNPHVIQYFCNISNITKEIPVGNYFMYKKRVSKRGKDNIPKGEIFKFDFKETLDKIEEIEYKPRGPRPSTTLHLGQLKLFLSTFQFLLRYVRGETVVIYPGSAPGLNIELLTELFPDVFWYLYDPRPFYERLKINKRVKISRKLFEDSDVEELVKKLRGKYVLMISDIRRNETLEELIDDDNRLHIRWIERLKPAYSQLKFRIPRLRDNNGEIIDEYNYLDGMIYLQYYARHTSTETRLVVDGSNIRYKKYSLGEYENRLYNFNRNYRSSIYPGVVDIRCLDNCYDCIGFKLLCKEYIDNNKSEYDLEELINLIIKRVPSVSIRVCKHYESIKRSIKKN